MIFTCKYWNVSLKHCAVQFLILLTISHTTSQTLCLIWSTNWSENKETIINHLNITESICSWTAAAECRQLNCQPVVSSRVQLMPAETFLLLQCQLYLLFSNDIYHQENGLRKYFHILDHKSVGVFQLVSCEGQCL